MSATPLSVFLPFNREVLGSAFEPAKSASSPPPQYLPRPDAFEARCGARCHS